MNTDFPYIITHNITNHPHIFPEKHIIFPNFINISVNNINMTEYKYVTVDVSGKLYLPASVRQGMEDKKYLVLKLPNGDVILHPLKKGGMPLEKLRKTLGPVKGDLKKIKQEIQEV